MLTFTPAKKSTVFLIILLVLAAFLRLYRIGDYLTFLGDEGRDVMVVYNILHGKFTLLGPTASVGGFFLGPVYYYFMAPFLWLSHYDPVGPAIMIALLGVATVWLVWRVTKEFFGTIPAFIAAILYTVSPLVITYSRSSWNPNPLPFFTLLCLFLLYRAIRDNKIKLFLMSGILFGIMMQLHYLATFVGVIIAAYIIIARLLARRSYKNIFLFLKQLIKDFLSYAAGFLIGFSPFLGFEVRHRFPNIKSIIDFILNSNDTGNSPQLFHTIGDVSFRLFGRLITSYPSPDHISWYPPQLISWWFWLTITLIVVTLSIFFYQLLAKQSYDKRLQKLLLFLWLTIGVVLFGFYRKNIYDYYFEFMFPLPFILVANMFFFLWTKHRSLKVITIISFVSILWVSFLGLPFRHEPNKQLDQARTIAKFVMDKTEGKPFNFALISGNNSDHAYRYFFTTWDHPSLTIENEAVDPERKTVTDQLFVVCESLPCSPLGHSLFEIAGFGRAEIAGHWKVRVVEVYKLVPYK